MDFQAIIARNSSLLDRKQYSFTVPYIHVVCAFSHHLYIMMITICSSKYQDVCGGSSCFLIDNYKRTSQNEPEITYVIFTLIEKCRADGIFQFSTPNQLTCLLNRVYLYHYIIFRSVMDMFSFACILYLRRDDNIFCYEK